MPNAYWRSYWDHRLVSGKTKTNAAIISNRDTGEERKTYLSILGKLYITGDQLDAHKVQEVATLVEEAIGDKIAADATSRNALTKLQVALTRAKASREDLTQSRQPSRAPSTAPSASAEGGEEADTSIAAATEAMENVQLQSTTTTPATSPRKRRSKQTPSRKSKSSQPVHEDVDEDGDMEMATSAPATPTASPRKSTRSRRTTTAKSVTEKDGTLPEQENIPPPEEATPAPSPIKKRGRPRKTLSEEVSTSQVDTIGENGQEPQVKVEEADGGGIETPQTRARPLRTAAPRKSVRAGRRKVSDE